MLAIATYSLYAVCGAPTVEKATPKAAAEGTIDGLAYLAPNPEPDQG